MNMLSFIISVCLAGLYVFHTLQQMFNELPSPSFQKIQDTYLFPNLKKHTGSPW